MKISKHVREEAILICSIAATTLVPRRRYRSDYAAYNLIAMWLPLAGLTKGNLYRNPAYRLAIAAWGHCAKGMIWTQIVDAEAVSLLQTGWSPR